MRDFTSDLIKNIKPSGIRKFFDIAATIPDCVSLGIGEPDFVTPHHSIESGVLSLEQGKTSYTSNQGLVELREEISKWNKRKYNLDYSKDEILMTVGASEAVDIAIRATTNPGDEVIILEPAFVSYVPMVLLAGGVPKIISLKNENDFKLIPEELEKVITPKTKTLFINFPNNPTGAIMTHEDYEKLIPIIEEHDLLVISDEIYSELTYNGTHCSIASFPNMKERTIVINGFSKAFAMTGWRLGYIMAKEEISIQLKKIHQYAIMCAPTMSQYTALESIKNGDIDVLNMVNEYDTRRKYILNEFKKMGIDCFEARGAFYLFPYIGKYSDNADEFALGLLNEEKCVVVPGTAFGDGLEKFVRISYATSMEKIKEALRRINRYINNHKNNN